MKLQIERFWGPSPGSADVHDDGVQLNHDLPGIGFIALREWFFLGVSVTTHDVVGVDANHGPQVKCSSLFSVSQSEELYKARVPHDCRPEVGIIEHFASALMSDEQHCDPEANLWWLGDLHSGGYRIFDNLWVHCDDAGEFEGVSIKIAPHEQLRGLRHCDRDHSRR